MKLTKRRAVLFTTLAAAVVAAGATLRPKPVTVETATATTGPLMSTIDEDSITRVVDRYAITTPVAGKHMRIDVDCGDAVASGDALVRIDPLPLDARSTAELTSRLDAANDVAREADASVRQARALLSQAEREQKRITELARSGIASSNDADVARTALANRRAELNAALARSAAARHDAEVVRASLDAAGGTLTLRAPVAGRVLRIQHESEGVVPAGTAILEVGDPRRLEIVIDALSTDAVNVRPGQRIIVDGWGEAAPLHAAVHYVEPSAFTKVSALGIEEQRVNVIASIDAPPPELGDGFQVQAHVVLWNGNVLKVPSTALFRDGDRWAVFAMRGGRARLQPVEIGHRSRSEVEIVRGLGAGARVIVHPSDQIADGVRIRAERG